ncbi:MULTISPECIES: ABC transporter permease [Microbacterium]|uniref:Macrolide export ATP-binding/permease protein MacB n=1 Tax=Microbacterium trichothecenolyticum TaxID=69370 RepID=A0A0M2HBW0_MICTR|nr:MULTISPECIES: ABC transporter permease [Microbacterium]KJL44066.1 Macrolide export ATP-binding/permease protein MacB [Microbacterium trichothecenolyticum]MDR7189150.1 putative ABC transport system permease protein [Microbacterium sp. BE35]
MSGLVGALGEAWSELRHHKLRVLLSLIGIAVSVGALTAVVALSEYQRQQMAEQSDQSGGRPATLSITASRTDGAPMDWESFDAHLARVSERYSFSHLTRIVDPVQLQLQTPEQVRPVMARLVDPAYAVIHRSAVLEGRWFQDADAELLAPPAVITEALWDVYGRPALGPGFALSLQGDLAGRYTVVGVTPRQYAGDEEKRVTLMYDSYAARRDALPADAMIAWETWVPEDGVADLGPALAADLRAGQDDIQVSVNRTDWASRPDAQSSMAAFEVITGGIAGLVLLLGGLGLVNIQLVAMRQRIREIGVRRSFGATQGRIFTSVLLESVVATAVAGVIGIAIAVAVLKAPFVMDMFSGMQDIPPFPVRAAVTGLVAAVAIGALAGFIPALMAVRSNVIDALRF